MTKVFWIMGVGLILGLFFQVKIKPTLIMGVAKAKLKNEFTSHCKNNPKCEAAAARQIAYVDKCFTLASVKAIGTPKESEAQRKTVYCMQSEFLRDNCKTQADETRCLASLDSFLDECYATHVPVGANPSAPSTTNSLLGCLDQKAGTKLYKTKLYK